MSSFVSKVGSLPSSKLIWTAAVAVVVPLAAICYWLLSEDSEEQYAREIARLKKERENNSVSRNICKELKIPSKFSGAIIGVRGSNIKQIQESTNTRINFDDNDASNNEMRAIKIRGQPNEILKAEQEIYKIVSEAASVISDVMLVPEYAIGKIIGRNGDRIRELQSCTRTKINIPRNSANILSVEICGTSEAIGLARQLISEHVLELEFDRSRNRGGNIIPNKCNLLQSPIFPESEEYLQVMVSSLVSVKQFCIQLVTTDGLNLDPLTKSMTGFYSDFNQEKLSISLPKVGDLVAAPFPSDDLWYRARIKSIDNDTASLFYIDFGDEADVAIKEIYPLESIFFYLPAQAVEVGLEGWMDEDVSDEVIDKFEELSHVAQWVILRARKVGVFDGKPVVSLFDDTREINISKQLKQFVHCSVQVDNKIDGSQQANANSNGQFQNNGVGDEELGHSDIIDNESTLELSDSMYDSLSSLCDDKKVNEQNELAS